MQKIFLSLVPALLLFSASVFADSSGSTQYAGFKEWKSPNLGKAEGIQVTNVDDNSNLEIILLGDRSIHIFEHYGTTYREEWTSQISGIGESCLVAGDFDGDNKDEFAFSTVEWGSKRVHVFGFNGSSYSQEWQSAPLSGHGYEGLHLYTADSDGDGLLEIVATSDSGNNAYIWIYGHNGISYQQEWNSGLLDQYDVIGLHGISDTDGDGLPEMVFASEAIYVVGWDGNGYQLEWKSSWLGGWLQCLPGEVNTDGTSELVCFVEEGNVRVYRFDGSTYVLEWHSMDIEASTGEIGDVDNDGIQEIAVGSFSGEIYVYGYDGFTYQLEWYTATSSPFVFVETIADFDGYGGNEILAQEQTDEDSADETGFCYVLTYVKNEYQLSWKDEKLDSYFGGLLEPAGDVDNDGIPEEVRFANNESRYYPYSIYVIGPAKQMPSCSSPLEGDINGDCRVDFRDFVIMAYNWLEDRKASN